MKNAIFITWLPINKDRIMQKNKAPKDGRKKGTNAIEHKNVDNNMLKLLKLNSYNSNIDSTKCSTTINKVASIKFVI